MAAQGRRRLLRASVASIITAAVCVLIAGLFTMPAKADAPGPVSLDTLVEWSQRYSNWGRWGPDDQLGTMNFVTSREKILAGDMVKLGITVGTARSPKKNTVDPQQPGNPAFPSLYPKVISETDIDDTNPFIFWANPPAYTSDRWNFAMASVTHTHLDSLCHINTPNLLVDRGLFPARMGYNGRTITDINTAEGCVRNHIETLRNGIFTRGILFDATKLARLREGNNPWLAPGTGVTYRDFEELERIQGVTVRPGDVVLLYTGRWARRAALGPWRSRCTTPGSAPPDCGEAGFWYDMIPFFYERSVAQFGADAWNDTTPAVSAGGDLNAYGALPFHGFQAVMGIAHYDNLDLEALAATAASLRKWEFLFAGAPFPVVGGITSPINPIAVF